MHADIIAANLIGSDYLLFIGKFQEQKGIVVLSKAIPAIINRYPHLKIVFVGQDTLYGNISMKDFILKMNKKHSGNLVFPGFVTEQVKNSLIKYSRLVILPSLWENFAYTCLESLASSKIVIATKKSGFDEIIEDNVSGFLVDPGNSDALQKKVIECLSSEDYLKKVERNAYQRALDFDMNRISSRIVN